MAIKYLLKKCIFALKLIFMKIYSAPLQGFTEAVWRNVHSAVYGGIDGYYTPFLRYEHGEIRNKDIRDIERKNNCVNNLVPQIIAATPEEMRPLLELIAGEGYSRVDINMGCSFPLQMRKRHGAGLLPYPNLVTDLMKEVALHPEFSFSVKMRLGCNSKDEWKELLPIINDTPLRHVTMHPRLGVEQYKKPVDVDAFAEFYAACKHPVIYNGDLCTLADIQRIEQQFPALKGIMLGRGLLANPALGIEYREGCELTNAKQSNLVRRMHDEMFRQLTPRLQGNAQFLGKMKPYWEYLLPAMLKRDKKAILKATTIEKYMNAVNEGLANY